MIFFYLLTQKPA